MKKIIAVLIVIVTMCSCVACGKTEAVAKTIDGEPQSSQMKAICELATMDCYYHNVAKYTEKDASGILLWKKDKRFWVSYSGVVTIGIDASKLQMEVKDNEVTVTIPNAKVLSTKVDEESLTESSFYIDKDSADIVAEDQTMAYKEAQENMLEKASKDTALLANAQQRAQSLLEDYVKNIGNAVGKEYKISWIYLEEASDSKEE